MLNFLTQLWKKRLFLISYEVLCLIFTFPVNMDQINGLGEETVFFSQEMPSTFLPFYLSIFLPFYLSPLKTQNIYFQSKVIDFSSWTFNTKKNKFQSL